MTAHQTGLDIVPRPAAVLARPVVLVVDDDDLMRAALERVFVSAGLQVELYASGAELLEKADFDRPGCLILDVRMPHMSGIQVQEKLKQRNVEMPVIFVTASSDIHIAVAAMRERAADFIEKPFDTEHLLSRVREVIACNSVRLMDDVERHEVVRRMNLLTPREAGVLELIVAGETSKQIARSLGASHRTIDIHRHHLMEKMDASSLAKLIRMRLIAGNESILPATGKKANKPT